jgi:hypothetical protein
MSSDWDAHATAHLVKRAVLSHSAAVRAVIISLSPGMQASVCVGFLLQRMNRAWAGDDSGWKREMGLQLTVVEISPRLSAGEAAHVIQKHRVLVLVNLNGWTLHDRNDVFALQPSPVQARAPAPAPIVLLRSHQSGGLAGLPRLHRLPLHDACARRLSRRAT